MNKCFFIFTFVTGFCARNIYKLVALSYCSFPSLWFCSIFFPRSESTDQCLSPETRRVFLFHLTLYTKNVCTYARFDLLLFFATSCCRAVRMRFSCGDLCFLIDVCVTPILCVLCDAQLSLMDVRQIKKSQRVRKEK